MTYPGGKGAPGVAHSIINLMPPHRIYVEPFLGSGAVLRQKRPAELNIGIDLHEPALVAVAGMLGLRWSDLPGADPRARSAAVAGKRGRSAAADVGHAGNGAAGARAPLQKRKGDIGASPGRNRSAALGCPAPGAAGLASNAFLSAALTGWSGTLKAASLTGAPPCFRLYEGDALRFLALGIGGRSDCLVYCDPPYVHSTRSNRRLYGAHEMTDVDHERLLDVLLSLPCMVMLSGYASVLYSRRLKHWNVANFPGQTRRGARAELLWYNFDRPTVLHDYRFLGDSWRERQNLRRVAKRWTARLKRMPVVERQALLSAMRDSGVFGDGIFAPESVLQDHPETAPAVPLVDVAPAISHGPGCCCCACVQDRAARPSGISA